MNESDFKVMQNSCFVAIYVGTTSNGTSGHDSNATRKTIRLN